MTELLASSCPAYRLRRQTTPASVSCTVEVGPRALEVWRTHRSSAGTSDNTAGYNSYNLYGGLDHSRKLESSNASTSELAAIHLPPSGARTAWQRLLGSCSLIRAKANPHAHVPVNANGRCWKTPISASLPRLFISVETPSFFMAYINMGVIPVFSVESDAFVTEDQANVTCCLRHPPSIRGPFSTPKPLFVFDGRYEYGCHSGVLA